MTTDQARAITLEQIKTLASGIDEPTREENVARLLERVAQAPNPEKLRALLTEIGAALVLDEGR